MFIVFDSQGILVQLYTIYGPRIGNGVYEPLHPQPHDLVVDLFGLRTAMWNQGGGGTQWFLSSHFDIFRQTPESTFETWPRLSRIWLTFVEDRSCAITQVHVRPPSTRHASLSRTTPETCSPLAGQFAGISWKESAPMVLLAASAMRASP